MSNSVLNFDFLALVLSEILGSEIKIRDPVPPVRPLAEKKLYPTRVLYYI